MTENETCLASVLNAVSSMQSSQLPDDHEYAADRRDGQIYAYTDDIVLALKVALITSRPLLLSGAPGCGKSSLASFVARNLGFSYQEYVADADSSPQDLLWRLDVIRRLNDAQDGALRKNSDGTSPLLDYLEPGPLWWALNPESASTRNLSNIESEELGLKALEAPRYHPDLNQNSTFGCVLLIDEIDKADASFCNGLLVPLGSRQFSVNEAGTTVHASPNLPSYSPLVIITTNGERDLPDAFIRRCISLPIPRPTAAQMLAAAHLHYPRLGSDGDLLGKVSALAEKFTAYTETHALASTAEFLDLVGTLIVLRPNLDTPEWELIERLVVEKPGIRVPRTGRS